MATPYEKPVPSFPTPNIEDALYVELADISKAAYRPFNTGEPYPDQTRFPGYKFLRQEPVNTQDGNDKIVRQIWAKDRTGQATYNALRKNVQEGASYPIFIRTYVVPRFGADGTPYTPTTTHLVPLGELIGMTISDFGTGYTAIQVDLAFAGGGGSGAAGYGIVDLNTGAIAKAYITNGGTGYTSAPTITAPGGTFAAVGVIQDQSALLVSEENQAADGELGNLYLSVTQVYHTLPGPLLRQWVWDEELRMFVKVTKRIIKSTDVPDTDHTVATNGVIVEYQPLDANRYVEITSSIVYASGGSAPSSFTYPTVVQHYPLPNEIITSPAAPFIFYVWAINTNQNFDMDVGLFMNIREGFNGPFKGRVTEYYTFNPSGITLPSLTTFNPQAHNFGIGWWYASDSQATARIVNLSIPQTLHPEIEFGVSGDSGSASFNSITIPATVPTSIPQETWITINFTEPRPYKFGLYIYRKLEIYIPNLD